MRDEQNDLAWFALEGSPLKAELLRLAALHEKQKAKCKGGHTLRKILNRQYNELVRTHIHSGSELHNKLLAPLAARAHLNNLCALPGIYRHLITRANLVSCSLLDAIFSELNEGRLVPAYLCMRALIEHTAHNVVELRADILRVDFVQNPRAVADQLLLHHELLQKAAYPTRVGLKNIISGESIRSGKKREYKPEAAKVDLTAKSILGAVDKLGKKVVGVRNIYDVLCEFAHPNIGARFAVTEDAATEPEIDAFGIIWKTATAGPDNPVSFARIFAEANTEILACVADCIEEMLSLSDGSVAVEDEYFRATQFVARNWISTFPKVYQPYEQCPCCSGKKLRFCCGANT